MGTPIGGELYRTTTVAFLAQRHAKVINGLRLLKSPIAFTLLKQCINMRMVYLTRVNHPDIAFTALDQYDQAVNYELFRQCCDREAVASSVIDKKILFNIATVPYPLL
jgi:hypothetical protein